MDTKSAALDLDVHKLVLKKQEQIKEKYGVKVQVRDIVNNVLRKYVDEYDLFDDILKKGDLKKEI